MRKPHYTALQLLFLNTHEKFGDMCMSSALVKQEEAAAHMGVEEAGEVRVAKVGTVATVVADQKAAGPRARVVGVKVTAVKAVGKAELTAAAAEEEVGAVPVEVAALMVAAAMAAAVGESSCTPDGCRTPPSHLAPRSSP